MAFRKSIISKTYTFFCIFYHKTNILLQTNGSPWAAGTKRRKGMKRKRFLAVLLALCMTLGTLPMTAFAAEDMPSDEITEIAEGKNETQEENEPAEEETETQEENGSTEEETDVTDDTEEETDGDINGTDETDPEVCTETADCAATEHEADCPKADDTDVWSTSSVMLSETQDVSTDRTATVSLLDSGAYYTLKLSKIDLATFDTDYPDGLKFFYSITVNMNDDFDTYIAPSLNKNNRWDTRYGKNYGECFTIILPPDLFDENLEVEWNDIRIPTKMELKKEASKENGVILHGKSGVEIKSSTDKRFLIKVPVHLSKEQCQAAVEKGSISLNTDAKIIVKSENPTDPTASPPDLHFSAEHSIKVIDGNHLKHSLDITEGAPEFVGAAWQLTDGACTISGEAENYEGIEINGDVTLTLNNATIKHDIEEIEQYAPAISVKSGSSATLILSGDNTVEGSPGYAGIYVAEGATLTIKGTGSLSATGGQSSEKVTDFPDKNRGYWGGGAGIGGNGLWAYRNDTWVDGSSPNFGTIQIEGGTIKAVGGDRKGTDPLNVGGGAGIGSGGCSSQKVLEQIEGSINIIDGKITAIGGDGFVKQMFSPILTGGGAGIGSGGVLGNIFVPYNNNVKVSISGGDITATGKADGAGIGGGANADGGIIKITNGTIYAEGGYQIEEDGTQREYYGGAGIGGGDNGGLTSITITGGNVTAKAIGAAAGIGSGNDGFVGMEDHDNNNVIYGEIKIDGDAKVIAIGGSGYGYYSSYGGAGIGAGCSVQYDNECGEIYIGETTKVSAFAGGEAQAVGVGAFFAGPQDNSSLSISDKPTLLMANRKDCTQGAFWGLFKEGDEWNIDKSELTNCDSPITYYVSDTGINKPAALYDYSKSETKENAKAWTSTNDTLKIYKDDTTQEEEQTFTIPVTLLDNFILGNWAVLSTKAVAEYTVNFDLNGGKGDSFIPIIATDGSTITIHSTQPTRSGYKFQGWKDETTGTTYQPGDSILVTSDMTLVAQWKKKPSKIEEYRLHYESNGGTKYSDEWYEEGTKVSLDKVPKRSGYEFTGWYADEELEDKIKSVTMNTDKTVYAGWKKIKDSDSGGGKGDHKPADVPQLNKEDHFAYVSGYPEGDFRPERNMTRAEVAVMFSNLLLEDTQESTSYGNTFTDVAPSEWYYDRVGFMEQFGIISGYPDGSFKPNAPITRAEFATIAAKFDELKETGNAAFIDLPDDHWGKKFIEMAYNRGWISGYPDGTVKPDKYITRAEVVSVTNRMLERICDQAYIESHKASIKDYFDITNAHWAYYHIMEASNGHLYTKGEESENWLSLNP